MTASIAEVHTNCITYALRQSLTQAGSMAPSVSCDMFELVVGGIPLLAGNGLYADGDTAQRMTKQGTAQQELQHQPHSLARRSSPR